MVAFGLNVDTVPVFDGVIGSAPRTSVAVAWAHPTNDALRNQYTWETFYRFHVTPNLAITPDFQLVLHPALNPGKATLVVIGLRTRVSY